MKEIKTVCVCGAGTMGSGMAQVCAMAGKQTILYDVDERMLAKAELNIEQNLTRLIEKSKITSVWSTLRGITRLVSSTPSYQLIMKLG